MSTKSDKKRGRLKVKDYWGERVLRNTAKSSPIKQILSPVFWFEHWFFLIVLALGSVSVFYAFPLTVGGVTTLIGSSISVIIFGIGFIAVVQAVFTLSSIHINRSMATYVWQKADEILRDIRSDDRKVRPPLSEIASRILPQSPGRPAVGRMVHHILAEAKDREFNYSANVSNAYREETKNQVNWAERFQHFALRIGILGTFLGIAIALRKVPSGIQNLLTNNSEETAGAVFAKFSTELISSLGDAFGTSVAGLVTASVIWLVVYVLRTRQQKYFAELDRAAEVVTSLARNAINDDKFYENFRRLIDKLEELRVNLFDRVEKLSRSVEKLSENVAQQSVDFSVQVKVVEAQQKTIQEAFDNISKSKRVFDSFLVSISKQQTEVLQRFDDIYTRAELPNALVRIENAVGRIGEDFNSNFQNTLGTSLEDTRNTIIKYLNEIGRQVVEICRMFNTGSQSVNQMNKSLSQMSNAIRSSFSPQTSYPMTDAIDEKKRSTRRLSFWILTFVLFALFSTIIWIRLV